MGKVGLFIPCYVDQFFPRVGLATLRVLRGLGLEVEYPRGPDLLRAAHVQHRLLPGGPAAGRAVRAPLRAATRRWWRPSASCVVDGEAATTRSCSATRPRSRRLAGAHLRPLRVPGRRASKVTRVDGEFRAQGGAAPQLPRPARAARVAARSERHGRPVRQDPAAALAAAAASSWWSWTRPDECCGFGGTFAVTEEAVSCMMGRDRIADHVRAGAEVIAGVRHVLPDAPRRAGPARRDEAARCVHVAEMLEKARLAR